MSGGTLKVDVTLATDEADWGDPKADALIFVVHDQDLTTLTDQVLSSLPTFSKTETRQITYQSDIAGEVQYETFLEAGRVWHLSVFLRQIDSGDRTYFKIPTSFSAMEPKQINQESWTLSGVAASSTKVTAEFSSLDDFDELGDRQTCGQFSNEKFIVIKKNGGVYDGSKGDNHGGTEFGPADKDIGHPSQCVQFINESNVSDAQKDIKAIEWTAIEKKCKLYFSNDNITKEMVNQTQRIGNPVTTSNCYMNKTVRDSIMQVQPNQTSQIQTGSNNTGYNVATMDLSPSIGFNTQVKYPSTGFNTQVKYGANVQTMDLPSITTPSTGFNTQVKYGANVQTMDLPSITTPSTGFNSSFNNWAQLWAGRGGGT